MMKGVERAAALLQAYDTAPVSIMEVCGTHTSALFKTGVRSLLPPQIRLISGPGCPVCVTPAQYIDRLIELAMEPSCCVLSFGDMLRVPGTSASLQSMGSEGARFSIVYSPLQALELAMENPSVTFVMAAVGFETTAPAYALLLEEAGRRGIGNIRLLTAIKTVLPAMEHICRSEPAIDAFLCPGHVSAIIGARAYQSLCASYHKPMAVAGFGAWHLLAAILELLAQLGEGRAEVRNLYPEAVSDAGNQRALALLGKYFASGSAAWRGIGEIAGSGLYLRPEYSRFDAGSLGLDDGCTLPQGCRCADVLCGRIDPNGCPQFGQGCTPANPLGACMVSDEGACSIWFREGAGSIS